MGERLVEYVELCLYSTITIIAVLGAAGYKNFVSEVGEIIAIAVGSGVGIALAHLWSRTIVNRLELVDVEDPPDTMHQHLPHWPAVIGGIATPIAVITVIVVECARRDVDISSTMTTCLAVLTLGLMTASGYAARSGGGSALKVIIWMCASVLIGLSAFFVKTLT
jgi:hypothetical protein